MKSKAAESMAVAVGAAGICVLIWGGVPIVTRVSAAELDPVLIGLLRSALPLPLIAVLIVVFRLRLPMTPAAVGAILITAASAFIAFPILFTIGQARTSAAHGGLLFATLPVLTGVLAAVVARTRPGRLWIVGAAVAFAGEYWLVTSDTARAAGTDRMATLTGDLTIFAAILLASFGHVAGGRLAQSAGPLVVTVWSAGAAALITAPFAVVAAADVAWAEISPAALAGPFYLAFLASVACYVLWYWAMRVAGITRVATAQFAQPLVTILLAAAILGETVTVPLLAAGAVILFGVFLCQQRG